MNDDYGRTPGKVIITKSAACDERNTHGREIARRGIANFDQLVFLVCIARDPKGGQAFLSEGKVVYGADCINPGDSR